ncbi:hypothetical protein NPX79_02615 [Spiroplasma endosymbiont of Anurida maritima]|uniref:hypothetical protein n=1 Tax=Spiroplasma endosymbiont of Anurida maritima TaxID=2967972 RepID=UPI0036D275E9
MKKLLNVLGCLTFTTATVATVVACGTELTSNPYKDSELNDIKNKNIVSQVRATSQLAKIMIGGRHENGNYNSVPMYGFFNSSSPNYKLNNGLEVDFSLEKNELQNLQPELKDNNPIDGPMRRPQSSYVYEKGQHNQGLVREGKAYNYNDNIWSYYDTGALTNYTILNNEAMKETFIGKENHFWNDKRGAGFLSEELVNSNLYDKEEQMFEYKVGDETISYGKESASALYGSYQKSALGVIDLVVSSLQSFGQGNEFIALAGLNKIIPMLKTTQTWDAHNLALIVGATGVAHDSLIQTWFLEEDSPLEAAGVNLDLPEIKPLVDRLISIQENAGLMMRGITLIEKPGEANLFGNENVDVIMSKTLEISSIIREILTLNKDTFKEDVFNSLLGQNISSAIDTIFRLIPMFGFQIYPQAKSFLLYFAEAFKSENFPTWQLTSLIGEVFKPFLQLKDGTKFEYEKNKEFEAIAKDLYNYSGPDYNPNIHEIDPTSDYGKKIKEVHGVIINEDGSESYRENSIFGGLDNISNNPNNPFNQAMQETVYSGDGFYNSLYSEINNDIQQSWFDLVFMDKNWDIKADGIGVNNTKLGLFTEAQVPTTGGKLVETSSITYQLDYYGPKDESTDLSLHENEIDHVGAKNIPDYIKNLSQEDQMKYDGLGNKYMENSDEVKYSYIVTIANVGKSKSNQNWKFVDFEWYYNNQRHY